MKPAGDERTPDGGGAAAAHLPDREQLLSVHVDDRTESYVLVVTGAVDGLTAGRLRDAIGRGFVERGERPLVVDLSQVTFFGSPGLRSLSEAAEQASVSPGFEPLRVVVDHNRPVIRPIELVGMDAVLALYFDLSAAVIGEEAIE